MTPMETLIAAAKGADWEQVRQNGGPPCFHLAGGRFCLRAKRWDGHDAMHTFTTLDVAIHNAVLTDNTPTVTEDLARAEPRIGDVWLKFDRHITVTYVGINIVRVADQKERGIDMGRRSFSEWTENAMLVTRQGE